MIKNNYSKMRSSCQPKTERKRKILGGISKIKKSRRIYLLLLKLVIFPLRLPAGRIEKINIMQYTFIRGLGLVEK